MSRPVDPFSVLRTIPGFGGLSDDELHQLRASSSS